MTEYIKAPIIRRHMLKNYEGLVFDAVLVVLFCWCYGSDMGVDAFIPVEETFHVDFIADF